MLESVIVTFSRGLKYFPFTATSAANLTDAVGLWTAVPAGRADTAPAVNAATAAATAPVASRLLKRSFPP